MKLKVQSIHFDADKKLLDFIEEKVNKLSHYYEGIIGGEVFLRLEKSNQADNKITEIKLQTPGKMLFAKEQESEFFKATDKMFDELKSQLLRYKEKIKA